MKLLKWHQMTLTTENAKRVTTTENVTPAVNVVGAQGTRLTGKDMRKKIFLPVDDSKIINKKKSCCRKMTALFYP